MKSITRFARTAGLVLCIAICAALAAVDAYVQQAATPASSAKAQRRADRGLAHDACKALVHESGLDLDDVRIVSWNGTIGLAGSVPDENQLENASTVAAGVPGLKAVRSYLAVREEGR